MIGRLTSWMDSGRATRSIVVCLEAAPSDASGERVLCLSFEDFLFFFSFEGFFFSPSRAVKASFASSVALLCDAMKGVR